MKHTQSVLEAAHAATGVTHEDRFFEMIAELCKPKPPPAVELKSVDDVDAPLDETAPQGRSSRFAGVRGYRRMYMRPQN